MTEPTALIVPMAGADPVVRPLRRARYGDGDAGMPAHVTLLYPFLPQEEIDGRVRSRLRGLFHHYSPFHVHFRRTVRKEGLLYLDPEPADPFVALHGEIRREWPALLPYGGKFGLDYTAHLSIAYGEDGRIDPNGFFGPLEAALEPHLPLQAHAQAVWLVVRRDEHWVHQGTFPFAGGAPVFRGGDGRGE